MGHSNGAVSATEYMRYDNTGKKENLIQGLILSSSRNGAYIDKPMSIRTIILHHKNDGCPISTSDFSEGLFQTIKGYNRATTQFNSLTTGAAESGHPCVSGYHMYNGASDEAVKAIEAFALKR